MARTKNCCANKGCEHEIAFNYDKETGWIISANSPAIAKILDDYKERRGVLTYKPLSDNQYAEIKTKDSTIAKLLMSEICG